MNNILVIGGSGLFGSKTIQHLVKDKEISKVVSMDVIPPRPAVMQSIEKYGSKFQFVRGDVSQIEDILNAIKTYSIDKVVNWAFLLGDNVNLNPRNTVKINILGMSNAFEAARIMGIKRVIYASSETLYGHQSEYGDREVTEDDRLFPSHSYALCKHFAELQADNYTQLYGMNFTALRPTIVFNHGGQQPMIVKWIGDIISLPAVGKPVSLDIDGKALFSFVNVDDIARITTTILKAPSSPHPAYNIGGPPASLLDVAAIVRRYIPDAKIEFGMQPMTGQGRGANLPWKVSCARAKKDFGFTVMPLEQAVLMHINDARLEGGLKPISG
jgi:nucleoside-diphosphate-sugar epimerase